MIKVVYLGGMQFAVPALKALVSDERFELLKIACPLERPSGRGMKIIEGPVATACHELGITCDRLSNEEEIAQTLENLQADFCVVCAFGVKLGEKSLTTPKHGCINIHASLLPLWRGAAPIERAILAGDEYTGVTTIKMAQKIDAGEMLLQEKLKIKENESAGELHNRLSILSADLLVRTLIKFDSIKAQEQTATKSYAKKIKKEEAKLDWQLAAKDLAKTVRAFNPRPGAFFEYQGQRIKVMEAQAIDLVCQAGLVAKREELVIGCSEGSLKLIKVIPAGSKAMSANQWRRGLSNTLTSVDNIFAS